MNALAANTSGFSNTANGVSALLSNTTGFSNTANGVNALRANTTGNSNTANGEGALFSNTTGNNNTANGQAALYTNSTGFENTASGRAAMYANTTGFSNTAQGHDALYANTTGNNITAIGFIAANDGLDNDLCVAVGAGSDVGTLSTSYANAIAIGYDCNTTAFNYARIGNTSITSIGGQVGWSNYSDGRFKRNVRENVAGLDFISRLRPVTYQWDIHALNDFIPTTEDSTDWTGKYDIEQVHFSGFIAQEVEQAAQAVGYDFSGVDKPQNETTPYALRYAEFVVPLVKAVQEQQTEIGNLKAQVQAQQSENVALKTQLERITAALQGAGIAVGN